MTKKKKETPLKQALVINRFLEKLHQDRNECKQAKDYISKYGFPEAVNYLEGRQDCLSGLIEQNYIFLKNV